MGKTCNVEPVTRHRSAPRHPPCPGAGVQKHPVPHQDTPQRRVAVRGARNRVPGAPGAALAPLLGQPGLGGPGAAPPARRREGGKRRPRGRPPPLPAPGRPPSDNAPGPRAAARGISSELSRRLTRGRVRRKRKPGSGAAAGAGRGAAGPGAAAARPALGAAGAAEEEGAGGGGRSPPAGPGGGSPRGPSPRRALPAAPLSVRGFWPLLTALCTALLCLYQALRGGAAGEGAGDAAGTEEEAAGSGVPLLKGSALLLLGCLLARCCGAAGGGPRRGGARCAAGARRGALERFHERQLRVSPHVLGHSKAHVGRVVAELVRAAKAQGLQPGPLALSLRGDFVRIGSAYEQHKVRSPDCFDILVPLRLPPHLEPQPRCAPGLGPRGAFVCGLRARDGWSRRCRPFAEGFCVELQGRSHLSSGLVLRWFQGHLQRCLGAVRYRLQERCRISLSACPGHPPTLHILPCSDYVCCHISMAVRLIPAIPLGDALYLTALPPQSPPGPPAPEALWGLNASRQEQRLLGWLKEQAPASSCHLKCLQILKGLRDLRGQGLEEPFCSQWGRVLSSYVLKTALFSVLLQGPLEAWDERFLVERLEDLVLYLRDCLRKQVLMDFFLGNTSIPEAVALPRFLKEATPVNLLAAFDGPTLDLVAFQLISTWIQAPHIIRMYSNPRYLRPVPTPCRHIAEAKQEPLAE
ncbi:inositol 1,4,5-trisphosphate receptor-interacting protein-like 2 [Manacus candei]|uniref:inositol 1,4,5-trisphosphate receptor-interacting protein-like 2 n=1 Tax=Manacus candei TaxID=415023 RepID=UPI00222755EF|nr:inositol 1,4,5-trisphosphate receptor-interacting protein-like 2 [Manacus candei]